MDLMWEAKKNKLKNDDLVIEWRFHYRNGKLGERPSGKEQLAIRANNQQTPPDTIPSKIHMLSHLIS